MSRTSPYIETFESIQEPRNEFTDQEIGFFAIGDEIHETFAEFEAKFDSKNKSKISLTQSAIQHILDIDRIKE